MCVCVCVCCCAGKLASRAQKIAAYLLQKLGGGKLVQPGDRVALVFRPDEPAQFATAFYGCIFATVVPVAIEPPVTKDVRKPTLSSLSLSLSLTQLHESKRFFLELNVRVEMN